MVPYIPNLKSATVEILFMAGLYSSFAQEINFDPPWNNPPDMVEIPAAMNKKSVSMAGILKNAPNKTAANSFS